MSALDDILHELKDLPEPALGVLAVVRARRRGVSDTALLSESVLARDWPSPEEGAAWADS